MNRVITKEVKVGNLILGGGNPILIQSMTNHNTEDIDSNVSQIEALTKAGCDIIRLTVPNEAAAKAFGEIRKRVNIPCVADIHFDYKMAIAAIENGADKIRINPGNIGGQDKVREVVKAAKERNIPIRVGVNSGSLEKDIVAKYGKVTAQGLVESALDKVRMVEEADYDNIVISIKSSNVPMCVESYELVSKASNYPLHVGITEAGTLYAGNIKSSVGLGILLHEGIGDTIRVSLTGDPLEEIKSAKMILRSLGIRNEGIEVISCPTCGRTKIDLIGLANQVEDMVKDYDLNINYLCNRCRKGGN